MIREIKVDCFFFSEYSFEHVMENVFVVAVVFNYSILKLSVYFKGNILKISLLVSIESSIYVYAICQKKAVLDGF